MSVEIKANLISILQMCITHNIVDKKITLWKCKCDDCGTRRVSEKLAGKNRTDILYILRTVLLEIPWRDRSMKKTVIYIMLKGIGCKVWYKKNRGYMKYIFAASDAAPINSQFL